MHKNLIATPIVDKNGKRTTVNKKPVASPSSSALAIPAPVVHPAAQSGLTSPQDRDLELGQRFYDAMVANNKGRELGMDKNVFMMTCNDRMKKLFCDLMEKDEGFGQIISAASSPSLPDNKKPRSWTVEAIGLVYDKDIFNEFPNPYPQRKMTSAQINFLKLEAYRHALLHASRDKAGGLDAKDIEKLGNQPADKVEKVRDYVHLMAAFREINNYKRSESNLPEALKNYALSGEQPINDIVAVMRKHQTTDANEVNGILNGAAPSIAQGWL